jgi:hypothetical protein
MRKLSSYIFCIGILLFWSSIPSNAKDYNLEIIPKSKADACGIVFQNSKRDVLIHLDLGTIEPSDSLFGITLYMEYDNTKLYFGNDYAILNTLSERFGKDVSIKVIDDNHILLNAGILSGQINVPTYGDLPLIALQFTYIGDCPDSASLVVEELSFTSECKIPAFSNETFYIESEVKSGKNRYAKVSFDAEEKEFDETGKLNSTMILNIPEEAKVSEFLLKLTKSDKFLFSNFAAKNSDIEIANVTESDSSYDLVLNIKENTQEYFLDFEIDRVINENYDESIEVEIAVLNDCNCAKTLEKDTCVFANRTTSVTDVDVQSVYEIADNSIIVKDQDNNIEIYDLNGNCTKYQDRQIISFDDKSAGLYLVVIKAQNKIAKVRYLNIK